MFSDLIDSISLLFYWRWPKADGVITEVEVEPVGKRDELRLAVTYKFSIGDDGPYTGESFWSSLSGEAGVIDLSKKLCIGQAVCVRYRKDDPSINKLDRSVWQLNDGL